MCLLPDVKQSANIMIFVSKGYFKSINCFARLLGLLVSAGTPGAPLMLIFQKNVQVELQAMTSNAHHGDA